MQFTPGYFDKFATIVFFFRRAGGEAKLVESRHAKRKRLILYIKLFHVLGLTWILAFLASIVDVLEPLWYVFAFSCSLQGVYIFLAFVCTRRVWRMLREKAGYPVSTTTSSTTKRTSLHSSRNSAARIEVKTTESTRKGAKAV